MKTGSQFAHILEKGSRKFISSAYVSNYTVSQKTHQL